jgi:uncharacterized protein (TIGR04222 family)
MSLGPFDLTGGPFLTLYLVLLAGTLLTGFIMPRLMRPEGRAQSVEDEDQLAYLAGGASRFAETVAARMLSTGALMMTGKDAFAVASSDAAVTSAERTIAGLRSPLRWKALERELASEAEPVKRQMVTSGLLMTDAHAHRIRLWVTMPFIMLLAFGSTKWIIGHLRDRPVGFLTVLLIVTALCAIFVARVDRRTQAGHNALTDARRNADRLSIAPTSPEVGLAVALFGTTVLAGSGWDAFHRLRSGGEGNTGSGGCSGCGGGGCGGCGG